MKTLLFRPFERYSERLLLGIGSGAAAVAVLLSVGFNARFDGALDLHFSANVSWFRALADHLTDIWITALLLFFFGWQMNRKTRFVDILNGVLIARIPMYMLAFGNAGNFMTDLGEQSLQLLRTGEPLSLSAGGWIRVAVFALLTLLFIVWSVALLWNGFRIASNGKGAGAVIRFIIALFTAEILTKIVLGAIAPEPMF